MHRPDQGWRAWIVDHAPLPLLTHAYEVGLAVVFSLLALPALDGIVAPGSIHAVFPNWMAQTWSVALLVAALATLVGLFSHRPRLEWLGQNWFGWTLTLYGAAILSRGRTLDQGTLVACVFLTLGAVGFWRAFKVTSRPYVQHRLLREAEEVHRQAAATADQTQTGRRHPRHRRK